MSPHSSLEKLDIRLDDEGKNYMAWSYLIEANLVMKDKWDETNNQPKNEKSAAALLITNVEETVILSIREHGMDAVKIWKALKEKFLSSKFGNIFRLQKELFRVGKNFEDVKTLGAKIKQISEELKLLGKPVDETTKICLFLEALPELFNPYVGSISANITEETKLDEIITSAKSEELRLCDQECEKETALKVGFAKSKPRFKINSNQNQANSILYSPCKYCTLTNHPSDKCRHKGAIERDRAQRNGVSVFKSTENKEVFDCYEWLIDSGASSHMTSNKTLFETFRHLPSPIEVELADDSLIQATGTGDVLLQFSNTKSLRLKNVLYVPELSANLISISRIVRFGHHVVFDQEGVHCIDKNGKEFATGQPKRNLFILKDLALRVETCNLVRHIYSPAESLKLWHNRLGHLNHSDLARLGKGTEATGISLKSSADPKDICEGCQLGKLHRSPFHSSKTRTSKPLELIHSDICGPFQIETPGKKRYFITFIDDYSRYTMVYLLQNKSQALDKFKEFVNVVSNQIGNNSENRSVKILRSDNGGEYLSKLFDTYCKSKGIIHQLTAPYSPQQNGVAERMNRTLVEMIRCMLHQSKTPLSFWGEALFTAVYIRNRVPSSANDGKTPFTLWYGSIPDLSNLRIFWCDAFVHVPDVKRKKLDAKARKCKFVGYSLEQKAYRFWDPVQRKIIISRDVVFDENSIFVPPQDPPNNTTSKTVKFSPILQVIEPAAEQVGALEPVHEFIDLGPDPIENDPDPEPIIANDDPAPINALEDPQVNEALQDGGIEEHDEDEVFQDAIEDLPIAEIQEPVEQVQEPPPAEERRYPVRDRRPPQSWWESARICTERTSVPTSLLEAHTRPDWKQWEKAVLDEYQSLIDNETWEVAKLPKGKNLVGSKWVFKVKENADGSIDRYKARLVAQGFSQKFGVDYEDTFAPVAKFTSIRTILAIGANRDMEIHQMDVKTAFLNSKLQEEIYMKPPPGFETPDGSVLKLKKTLYGLKQSPREWYKTLAEYLKTLGFRQSNADTCIFVKWENDELTIISVYVDDLIILSDSMKTLQDVKQAMNHRFKMSDLGELKYCLGLEISRDRKNRLLRITQEKYIRDILQRFRMDTCHPVSIPLEPKSDNAPNQPTQDMSNIPYRSAVGSLMYAMKGTRPDIAAAFGYVSKFLENPQWCHWVAVKRILKYLQGTIHYGLVYGQSKQEFEFEAFSDSDWAADKIDRRSISGNIFKLYGAPISWLSKKQQTVALSSTEAEYMAASLATQELIWLRNLLQDLSYPQDAPTTLYLDNQGSISLSKDATDHARTKHIDIRHHFIREKVVDGSIKIKYIETSKNEADLLTKGLPRPRFEELRTKIGVSDLRLSGSVEDSNRCGQVDANSQGLSSRSKGLAPYKRM